MRVDLHIQIFEKDRGFDDSFFKALQLSIIPQVGWTILYEGDDEFTSRSGSGGTAEVVHVIYDLVLSKIRILAIDSNVTDYRESVRCLKKCGWREVNG